MDRFDTAEALNVLAHDYGLYAVKDALNAIGFRASPMRDRFERLSDDALAVYRYYMTVAEKTDPYTVPYWAKDLLRTIERGDDD